MPQNPEAIKCNQPLNLWKESLDSMWGGGNPFTFKPSYFPDDMFPWLQTDKLNTFWFLHHWSDIKQYCAQIEQAIKLEVRKPDSILHLSLFLL